MDPCNRVMEYSFRTGQTSFGPRLGCQNCMVDRKRTDQHAANDQPLAPPPQVVPFASRPFTPTTPYEESNTSTSFSDAAPLHFLYSFLSTFY